MSTTSVGAFWIPQVHTAAGPDPEALVPVPLTVVGSIAPTAAEQQRMHQVKAAQDSQHQATMAGIDAQTRVMTAGHQQRMHDIAASGAAHQQRMADLQDTWQSQQDSWRAAQADARRADTVSGSGHLDYLNMIKEERTVIDSDGHSHQVTDVDADRYFYNAHERRWIGLQQHEDLYDVARAQGLDPTQWQEGRLKS